MADEQDEDAMFDRLAKSLRAVRQDAELIRSSGAEGVSAGLARAEAELRGLAVAIESLRDNIDKQRAVTQRLEAAAAKSEADLQGLRQIVEALSRRVVEQAEVLARSSVRKPPPRAGVRIGIALVVLTLALGGGVAAWIASGSEPTLGALVHRVVVRFSELSGIDLVGLVEPTPSVRTGPQATRNPDPAPLPQASAGLAASVAPAPAAPAPAEPPPAPASTVPLPAAAAAPASTPSVAPLRPPDTPAAVSPPSAEAPAATASPPAAALPALPATEAALRIAQSEPPAPAGSALTQPSGAPQSAHELVLRATADAWVQVRQKSGRVLLSRTLKTGDTWPVPADPDLILDAGNVEGLDLEVDGVPIRFTGAKGGVVHNVLLGADLLRSGVVVRSGH